MTREVHRVAFILQDSNSGYANQGSGEEGDYSNVLFFPGEVKTETLLHPFKPKSSYVRSYLPGFLQNCPHPFTSSLYGVNSGVPRADSDPSNATALSSSQRAGCYDNPYSLWGAGCSWTQPSSSSAPAASVPYPQAVFWVLIPSLRGRIQDSVIWWRLCLKQRVPEVHTMALTTSKFNSFTWWKTKIYWVNVQHLGPSILQLRLGGGVQ